MDQHRFEAIVAAYGAEPNRWPETERDAAKAFADANASACAEILANARALDVDLTLAAPKAAEINEVLVASVVKASRRVAIERRFAPMALAACALLGVLIGIGGGVMMPLSAPASDGAEEILAVVLGGAADVYTMGDGG